MRRVSSRQRLVSWDAFDATADESETASDVASVVDDDYHSAIICLDSDSSNHNNNMGNCSLFCPPDVGRKRDRSTMRKSDSAGSLGATSLLQQLSSPPDMAATTAVNDHHQTQPPTFENVPTLISGEPWEIDYTSLNLNIGGTNNNLFHLKNSTSTNTLSSFVSTCSSLPAPASESITFDKLMKDMHVAIFAFLDIDSLQNVMAVNRSYRGLTLSEDAQQSLWQGHCDAKWKITKKPTEDEDEAPLKYVDHLHLPTAAAAASSDKTAAANLPLLLKMTPSAYPTGVDEDLVEAQNIRTERLRPTQNNNDTVVRGGMPRPLDAAAPAEDGEPGYMRLSKDDKGRTLVRYTGPIGAGDRCIRSNAALPRPQPVEEAAAATTESLTSSLGGGISFLRPNPSNSRQLLMNLWRRGATRSLMSFDNTKSSNSADSNSSSSTHPASSWKPFVMPFMENNSTVNVTPRLVSYYEVSILPDPAEKEDNDDDDSITGPDVAPRPSRSDCVAVGLATQSFQVHTRMPGWDHQSFGFHGDDGGIFHASGGMVKEFGSKFGEGDTIGCGVDYVNKGIFFTLNGRYLGYGWKGIQEEFLKNDLFPVVGLDSNCPLHFNFGQEEPFQFDFSKFLMKHESIIAQRFTFEDTKSPPKHVDSMTYSYDSCSSLASMASTSSATSSRRNRSKGRLSKRRGARDRR